MKRFISILGAGAIMLTSSAILLNGCTVKNQDEQSSSQTQTPQEISKEELLQIEKDKLDRRAALLDEATEHLKLATGCRDQCKVALDYARQSGDLELIQRAEKAVQDSQEQVNESEELYRNIKNDCSESFQKVLELVKEIKESKKDKTWLNQEHI